MSALAVIANTNAADAADAADVPKTNEQAACELVAGLVHKLDSLAGEFGDLKKFARVVERAVAKVARRKTKRRATPENSKPSGFRMPVKILPKLTMFLNDIRAERGESAQSAGECVARTEVTRFVTDYVRAHELQDPNEKKIIVIDAKLAALLSVPEGSRITWFRLQSVLAPLYDQTPEGKAANKLQKERLAAERAAQPPAAAAAETAEVAAVDAETAPPPKKRAKKAAATTAVADDDAASASASASTTTAELGVAKPKKTAAKKIVF